WDYRKNYYCPFDGKTWGEPSDASPVHPPERSTQPSMIAWQSPRRRGPIRSRFDASLDQAMYRVAEQVLVDVISKAVIEGIHEMFKGLYVLELDESAKLFAHIEMGGTLKDMKDSDREFAKFVMDKGNAKVFLSERTKFVEKLKEQGLSDLVLAAIRLDLEDHDASWTSNEQVQSRLLRRTRDELEEPSKLIPADTPAVKYSISHRLKDPKDTVPVKVHCSFVYTAQKEGRALTKTH